MGFDKKGKKNGFEWKKFKENDEEWHFLERKMVFFAVLSERGGEK